LIGIPNEYGLSVASYKNVWDTTAFATAIQFVAPRSFHQRSIAFPGYKQQSWTS
jgi:hypothetical protein